MTKRNTAISESRQLTQAFGMRVRAMLDSQGIKLADFAKQIGYAETYLNEVFNGSRAPSLKLLRQIIYALPAAPILWLLFGDTSDLDDLH